MRRRALWLAGAAALCVIAAGLWAMWPRERLLLARATRVADATGWATHPWGHYWLSEHEVLFFRAGVESYYHPARLDVRTGVVAKMAPLGRLLRAAIRPGDRTPARQWLSPDGKWLLRDPFRANDAETLQAFAVDGSRVVRETHPQTLGPEYRHVMWLPDSSGWVRIRGEDGPPPYRAFLVVTPLKTGIPGAVGDFVLSEPYPLTLGFAGDGAVLTCRADLGQAPSGRAVLRAYAVAGQGVDRTHTFPIPRTVNGYTCILSPRGDRLAWIMRETRVPAVSTFWQRVKALVSGGAHPRIGLWVSRADGSGLREIGHIDQDPRQNRLPDVPHAVRWTPDEQRLSFLYHGGLYTVPVD